jgi:hypothetical protein
MMLALPIVPPAADNELLGSWIQRTASVYDLSAHQLLDRWQVAPGPKAGTMPSVEMRVVGANAVPVVADRMRAPLRTVAAMIPEATDWIVACDADVAVCPPCLSDDDANRKARFRRRGWAQCWQVLCPQHRISLVDMQDWRSRQLEPAHIDRPHQRNANGWIVALGNGRGRGARGGRRGFSVRTAIGAIAQLEGAIRGALAGRRPHAPSWGNIEPEDFLRVVRDVTTFVLSRFEPDDQRRPLCIRDLHCFTAGASTHCFERFRQRQKCAGQGGLADVASLAQVGEVGWRRCALFWARELMHARTERSWLPLSLRRDRYERQRASLADQSRAGIEWLYDRAQQWPEGYRRQRWQGLEAAASACLIS